MRFPMPSGVRELRSCGIPTHFASSRGAPQNINLKVSESNPVQARQLRNASAKVLRDVQAGQTIVVTRNGEPVAELRPVRPRRFVPRTTHAEAAARTVRSRLPDLLIASIAASNRLPLYMRNPDAFSGLERLVRVETV